VKAVTNQAWAPGGRDPQLEGLKTTALIVYILYLASLIAGITSIVGVIIAHIKKGGAAGTIYESHFGNQIVTFWVSLLLGIIGGVLTYVLVGFLVLAFVFVWFLYRTIKGLIRLNDGRPYD
jgi:uncharacterized membrane protein